ncbi:hypothetical protein L6R53_06895 [Myxococcota bacterium]|nr:hypothetical protein [Myxococcota bacterium]
MTADRRDQALVLALGAALALAVLGPSLPRLDSHLLGSEYVDHYGTQWFYWFTGHALATGQPMGHTDLFFHPYGKDIFGHTGTNVLDALLALPFRAALGPVGGYNAFVLAGALANVLATWRLVLRFTADRPAALLSALLLGLSPFVLFELVEGRPTQALLLLPLLYLERLWATAERRGLAAPLAAGLLLAMTGYQYWYYAFFGGVVALVTGLWSALRPAEGSGGPRAVLARHALVALVAAALVAPVVGPMLARTSAGEGADAVPGLLNTALWTWGDQTPATVEGTVVGLYTWQPLRLTAGFFARNRAGEEIFLDYVALLPLPVVLLALGGLAVARPARGRLLAGLLACGLLALGPSIMVADLAFPNPLYIALAKALPFVRRLWWPARAMAFFVPLLGVAAALGLAWLRRRDPRAFWLGATATVALQGLHLQRNELLPFPAWDATIPAGYRCLVQGPPGALIELPYAFTQAHLYYQTVHGRPILGGMIENNPVFTPTESVALRQDNTWLRRVLAIGSSLRTVDEGWTEEDAQAVRALGYRYVVLQKDAFDEQLAAGGLLSEAIKARRRMLLRDLQRMIGRPVYDDARVSIHAPWGDPSPCADEPPAPDTEVVGMPDHPWFERTFDSPFARLVRRPIGQARPLTDYMGEASDDGQRPVPSSATSAP